MGASFGDATPPLGVNARKSPPYRWTFLCKLIEALSKFYSFSKNSQAEQEIYTPPGTPRSRSFTRFTIRVGFEHFGQSVLFCVSMTFLRSPVLAIFAMVALLRTQKSGITRTASCAKRTRSQRLSGGWLEVPNRRDGWQAPGTAPSLGYTTSAQSRKAHIRV